LKILDRFEEGIPMLFRRLLFAALIVCAPSMAHAQKTKAQIITEIPVLCPIGGVGTCTATNVQQLWRDIVNAIMPTAPVVSGNLACYNGTTGLLQDCGFVPAQPITCASHQWINVISAGGVPSCSQPAFTDISGLVAATQLPNPTASTLGGVESLAAVTHNFLTSISTSGVPTQAQPACADISNAGTACTQNTGTSGHNLGFLDGNNTYSGTSAFSGTATHSAQIISTFGVPTITSGQCGTGTNGSISGTNQSGIITIGAAATTTCTISFSTTITAPGACLIFPGNAAAAATGTTVARVGTPGTTTWVITGSALASTVYSYICL
jgi:hypothetical protein